jgi:hypothetical protein
MLKLGLKLRLKDMILANKLTPKIQHVFNVSDLLNFDMICIYHHMTEGEKVTLKRSEFHLDGNYSYYVYFKGFKIGTVRVSSLFTAIYGSVETIEGAISSMMKEKYLPVRSLDIIICEEDLKLVS